MANGGIAVSPVGGECAVVGISRVALRVKAVDWVVCVLVLQGRRYLGVGEENRLAVAVVGLLQHRAVAVERLHGTHVTPHPPCGEVLAARWRQHQRAVQIIRHLHHSHQRIRKVITVGHLEGQVLTSRIAVLTINVHNIQVHLAHAKLLVALADYVVVMEDV